MICIRIGNEESKEMRMRKRDKDSYSYCNEYQNCPVRKADHLLGLVVGSSSPLYPLSIYIKERET